MFNCKLYPLKLILRFLPIIVLSLLVYTVISYSNTFDSLLGDIFFKFCIAFIWGLVLFRFFEPVHGFKISIFLFLCITCYLLYPLSQVSFGYKIPKYSFVFTGMLLGYYWIRIRIVIRIVFLLLIITFGYLYLTIIYPSTSFSSIQQKDSDLKGKSIDQFLTGINLQYRGDPSIQPFTKGKVYLVEFYFKNCAPCILKHADLQKLNSALVNQEFEIVYIDNGAIDKWDNFYEKGIPTEIQRYDSAGLLARKLNITAYPFEIIIDKEGIIRYISQGHNDRIQNWYVGETIKKIKPLL